MLSLSDDLVVDDVHGSELVVQTLVVELCRSAIGRSSHNGYNLLGQDQLAVVALSPFHTLTLTSGTTTTPTRTPDVVSVRQKGVLVGLAGTMAQTPSSNSVVTMSCRNACAVWSMFASTFTTVQRTVDVVKVLAVLVHQYNSTSATSSQFSSD